MIYVQCQGSSGSSRSRLDFIGLCGWKGWWQRPLSWYDLVARSVGVVLGCFLPRLLKFLLSNNAVCVAIQLGKDGLAFGLGHAQGRQRALEVVTSDDGAGSVDLGLALHARHILLEDVLPHAQPLLSPPVVVVLTVVLVLVSMVGLV